MTVSTIHADLQKKLWGKQLWTEVRTDLFWKRFITEQQPEDMDKETGAGIVVQINDFKKEGGDTITLPLLMKLTGAGIEGDSTLEGYEEALAFYPFAITVDQIRNAVRLKGKMEEQRTALKLRSAAKVALKTWLREKIDKEIFTALCTSPTSARVLYGGDAAAVGDIVDADKLTSTLLSTAKRKAQAASPKFRPLVIDGKEFYVVVAQPYAFRDLKSDATIAAVLKDAWWRGDKNPIFSGAEIVYDGMVIYEHPSVRLTTEGASSANVAYNLFLGAGACGYGVAEEPFWEEDVFDYKNQVGFATGMIRGIKKTAYNSQDYATITIVTGAKAD